MNWREALTDTALEVLECLHDGHPTHGRAYLSPAPAIDPQDADEGAPWGIDSRLAEGLAGMGLVTLVSFKARELVRSSRRARALAEAVGREPGVPAVVEGEELVFTRIEITPLGEAAACNRGAPPDSVTGGPPAIGGLPIAEGARILEEWMIAREASLPVGARSPRAAKAVARLERDLGQEVLPL